MRNGLSSCAGVYGSRLLRSKGNMMFANRIWFYLSLGFIRCSLGTVLQTEENFTFIIWNWAVIQSPLLSPHPHHQRHCSKPVTRKVRTLNCKRRSCPAKNQTSEELMFSELNRVALGLNIKPSEWLSMACTYYGMSIAFPLILLWQQ